MAAGGLGALVATTPVRRAEYLLGKLLGSTALLGAVTAAFLVCIMGMHQVRGEGPLLPQVYVAHYLVVAGPCCLGVAARTGTFQETHLEDLERPPDAVLDSIADLPSWLGVT